MAYAAGLDRFCDLLRSRVWDWILADHRNGRGFTTAYARRVQDSHVRAKQRRQLREQIVGSGKVTGDRIANANRDRGRRSLAFLDNIEMVIKSRDFVDFRHGHLHLGGKRNEMGRGEAAVAILNLVEVFDQEIAAARVLSRAGR